MDDWAALRLRAEKGELSQDEVEFVRASLRAPDDPSNKFSPYRKYGRCLCSGIWVIRRWQTT